MTGLPQLMTACPSDVRKIATGRATVGGGGGGGGSIPGEKKCGSLVGLFIGGVVELAYKIVFNLKDIAKLCIKGSTFKYKITNVSGKH